jgi:arginase
MSAADALIPFAGCFTKDGTADTPLVFIGIPDDSQSTYRWGCSRGPGLIRSVYDGRSFNPTSESGVDLSESVVDFGDIEPRDSWESSAVHYQTAIESLLMDGKIPFIAGGDHAITIPAVEAMRILDEPVHVIQIDAHPDLYTEYRGVPHSHACTAARILEMTHVASLTQLGIRTLNDEQSKQLVRFHDRLRLLFARDLTGPLPSLRHIPDDAFVYLTVDMDGFDPAFAPGVSHPVPGGLTSRQVLSLIQHGHWNLAGMDVVELNPSVDVNNLTAVLAARLLHEGMGYAALRASKKKSSD